MSAAIYICPVCGCPDLMMPESSLVLSAELRSATCPNCNWKGSIKEASGILTTEKVYDIKAIGRLLFHVTAKHAAGPLAQALALIGLLDPHDQEGLDKIMRDVCAAMVQAAFTSAGEHAVEQNKKYGCSACRGTGEVKGYDGCPNCWGSGLNATTLAKLTEEQREQLRQKKLTKTQAISLVRAQEKSS
jgi:hypothetical protein